MRVEVATVFGVGKPGEDATVDAGMQSLDPAAKHLGCLGDI